MAPRGSPDLPPLRPARLTDFKMAGPLGSGATATVYEAVQIATGRDVAIKILEPSQAGPESRERFAREAILLASVSSKHVGSVVGFGFERGQPFLVLERLRGETLDAKLRRDGPVALPVAVRWIEQLLLGVRDCHDTQVIHRDIKPSNIFLHHEGAVEIVRLIDFGVARLREITRDSGGLTSPSHLIGSMGYMAPEQLENAHSVGFTADLYAVGVVVFRALTGRLPFVSRSMEAVRKMKAEQPAPAVSAMPNMPQNVLLDAFVKQAMAYAPADRFQTAREMLEHWWNVMASLDEAGSTDPMRGVARVDEPGGAPQPSAVPIVHRAPAYDRGPEYDDDDDDEERTERRAVPLHTGLTVVFPGPPPTIQAVAPVTGEVTTLDLAPNTVPAPGTGARADDHPEMPTTRNDPGLRRLVEQELELHRKSNPPPAK